MYGYDLETKMQSSHWKAVSSPRPKKSQQVWRKIKIIMNVVFEYHGIDHHEYAPEGQAVPKEYSVTFLIQFVARDWTHGPHKTGNCIMLTPLAHSLHLIQSFLTKNGILFISRLPYSLDLQNGLTLCVTSGCS